MAECELERMIDSLCHESRYGRGRFVDEELGVYAGWITGDAEGGGDMPVWNEQHTKWLILAGEEYSEDHPDPALTRGGAGNEKWLQRLVRGYEKDDTFPAGLNGQFHGLIGDRDQNLAVLFNDRYGMHRLYYHKASHTFYFAAEAKAILSVRPELRCLSERGVGEFVTCGCVLENRTLFRDIHVLPPASAWRLSGRGTERRTYFNPREWEELPRLAPEEYYQELKAVFNHVVPAYFRGEDRVGMSLTGGLDTRMILASYKAEPGTMPCYSFGSTYRRTHDVTIARRVAQARGQSHEVIPVGQDFLKNFPAYAAKAVYLTDGCVDVSHAADLFVNQRAAQIAPVRLTGNYGGEVLRRVRAFKPTSLQADFLSPDTAPAVRSAWETYDQTVQGHPLSFAVFRQAPWHHYGLLCLERTQLTLRSPFLDNRIVKTVYRAPELACTSNEVSLRLIRDGDARLSLIPTDRAVRIVPNGVTSKVAQAINTFTVKAEYGYDYGMPQWVSRIDHTLSALHLEKLFLGRHKFYHYRVWYRDALARYVREILLDPRTLARPYVHRHAVHDIVNGHLKSGCNYTSEIHKLLTLELISRRFIDRQ